MTTNQLRLWWSGFFAGVTVLGLMFCLIDGRPSQKYSVTSTQPLPPLPAVEPFRAEPPPPPPPPWMRLPPWPALPLVLP